MTSNSSISTRLGEARARLFGRLSPWLGWGLFALGLLLVFGESLYQHMLLAADPAALNDDVRQQIPPFFRYEEAPLFSNDYISDYYLSCFPIGYRLLYIIGAKTLGAVALSKALPYVLVALTVAGLAVAAHRFAGKAGAFIAAALCLSTGLYLARLSGGLPRGFGYPILAWALAALAHGKPRWLTGLCWCGALFYPMSAVVVGFVLGLVLVLPARDRGEASGWQWRRRLGVLAVTAGVAFLLLAAPALASQRYGKVITPAQVAEFPEAGPGGRYRAEDRAPFKGFFAEAPAVLDDSFRGGGKPIFEPFRSWTRERASNRSRVLVLTAVGVSLVGFLLLAYRRSEARRVLLFFFAVFAGHSLASWFPPYLYLPERYVSYPLPLFCTLLVAVGVTGFATWFRQDSAQRIAVPVAASVFGLSFLLLVGGRGSEKAGLVVARHSSVHDFLAKLPADVVVAGWPKGITNNVPYFARRQALVTYEAYQAFHSDFTLEMRRRTDAVVDAYFGTNLEPLQRLKRDFGVTHLIVERVVVANRAGELFKPSAARAARVAKKSRGGLLEVERQREAASVFQDGRVWVLDLRRLRQKSGVISAGAETPHSR